jgi:putative ABC transport system permease protein
MHLLVRTSSAALSAVNSIRNEIYALDKDQPVFDVKTMDEVVAESFARPRTLTVLLGVFAALALSLAAAGIYAVVSYSVAQRTHEIGIRVALGAQRSDILKLIIRQGMTLTVKSLIFGLIAALALTSVMSSLLFDVNAHDPITFAVVSALLVSVSLLATYLPARKALRVEPMTALRTE